MSTTAWWKPRARDWGCTDPMNEISGNIWDYLGKAVVVITTNGHVTKSGKADLGRGCARQAGERFPGLALHLGSMLRELGNHVHYLGDGIASFPVEENPWSVPDPGLIRRSARELRALTDAMGWQCVIVPRPGCGGGGLCWNEARPLVEEYFDDRFHIITSG
jgi:hypothetical protein